MSRDYKFHIDAICDICDALGAYSIMDDFICHKCIEACNEWGGECPDCGSHNIEENGDYYLLCLQCGRRIGWN